MSAVRPLIEERYGTQSCTWLRASGLVRKRYLVGVITAARTAQ